MLFDSHCHLHFYQFDSDREEIIKKLRDFNIKTINVGTDFKESEKAVNLAKQYPDLMWASVGLHPTGNAKENFNIDKYIKLAKDEKVVAIGECGLDYAFFARERNERLQKRASAEAFGEGGLSEEKIKEKPAPEGRGLLNEIERQKEIFVKQIELAKKLGKPIILHCRPSVGSQDAYEDAIEILKFQNLNISSGSGVAHFFSGSKETAKKFLDLGFYISFAGPITFVPRPSAGIPAAKGGLGTSEYREVVEFVPIDRILIETDAPFAAPVPYRGRRNEPAYVEFVARKIAEWKNLSFAEVARQTAENAKKLFQIK